MLRVSAKIFDPLGLLSPFSIYIKIIFQQLCLDRKGWDENFDGEYFRIWKNLDKELKTLNGIRVPRCCVTPGKPILYNELHGFSDASEKAYAAVVYLRTVYYDGETVTTRIVAAKNRVIPLKKQTIPRLELLGATILARLLSSVKSELEPIIGLSNTYHRVDSFTTLCWIKMSANGNNIYNIVLMKFTGFQIRAHGNFVQDLKIQLISRPDLWIRSIL